MDPCAQIVFIHKEDSWYLPYSLYQARHISPESKVVLLAEIEYKDVLSIPLKSLSQSAEAKEFKRLYIHMSTNPHWYEQFCFLRWFYLLEYMRSKQVESVFSLDSDVLLYTSMKDLAQESMAMGDVKERGACLFRKEGATAGISYWTRKDLEEFCRMLLDCYCKETYLNVLKDVWKGFLEAGSLGGVCDMTPLSLFYSADTRKIDNLTQVGGGVFDFNINHGSNYLANEFVMDKGMKKIIFKEKIPYFERNDSRASLVRAHALHFQGGAKGYMPLYYRGKNFNGKMLADVKGLLYRLRTNFKKF